MNVPKYVSKDDLKRQYHKLAKIYHPDILNSSTGSRLIPEETVSSSFLYPLLYRKRRWRIGSKS
jgi:hypothetical protein